MVGVLGGAAFGGREHRLVRQSFYEVALWLSIGYLALLAITLFLEPFSPLRGMELFGISTYWLAPFQGLVIGALGYLFTSETPDQESTTQHRPTPPAAPQPEGSA